MSIIKTFLGPEHLRPAKKRVLLEALYPEVYNPGSEVEIAVPSEYRPRYSNVGRVVAGGEEEGLEAGDIVIVEEEGEEVPRSYYDVFQVVLDDDGKELNILVDNDVEPVFRERVEEYRRNRTGKDYQLSVEDVYTGETYSFLCSDVLTYGYEQLAHPTYRLEYIPTFMIELYKEGKHRLHYIAPLGAILAKLEV